MSRQNGISRVEEIAVTAENYPFTSAKRYGYLDAANYEEAEYYMYGTANVYQTETDGSIGIHFPNAPYVNRFIVRKPSDPAKFSGNVVVEIINPTSFMDLERMWVLGSRQLMRNGDIYVCPDRLVPIGLLSYSLSKQFCLYVWRTLRLQRFSHRRTASPFPGSSKSI